MFHNKRAERVRCSVGKRSQRPRFGIAAGGLLILSIVFFLLQGRPLLSQQPASPAQQSPPASPQQATSPQQPGAAQQPTFSTDVKVVNVLASVRDKKGQLVNNLTQSDFTVDEDGRPQTITYFARETDLPLTLGLLVDTSLSQTRVIGDERDASSRFVDRVLREDKDRAFIIHFDREVELLQDLTSSRQKLESALDSLRVAGPQLRQSGGQPGDWPGDSQQGGGYGGGRAGRGGGTALYDTVYLASDELMRKQQGRKALIVLSDGVDNGSKVTLSSAIESAQRANAIVYSILFSDREGQGNSNIFFPGIGGMGGGGMGRRGGGGRRPPQAERADGKKILERMSDETGGRLFEVSKKQTFDQIYSSIEQELRNQYNLGYTPDRTDSIGYRKIHLTVKPKDLIVQTRDGYYFTP